MKYSFFILLFYMVFSGCVTFRDKLVATGSTNEMIANSIVDFTHCSSIIKHDSVFSVSVYQSSAKHGRVVRVGRHNFPLLWTDENIIGQKGGSLPTRFIVRNGLLFYWKDEDFPLTTEAIEQYKKYNILRIFRPDDVLPDFETDDAAKAVHYYFCKNDLRKYKRIISNIGVGYYDPPKLNCE